MSEIEPQNEICKPIERIVKCGTTDHIEIKDDHVFGVQIKPQNEPITSSIVSILHQREKRIAELESKIAKLEQRSENVWIKELEHKITELQSQLQTEKERAEAYRKFAQHFDYCQTIQNGSRCNCGYYDLMEAQRILAEKTK